MIEVTYTIAENALIASGVYRLKLEGDTSAITAPGQFLDLRLPGFFLRRPISICDWDEKSVTLLYKVVGGGTDWLSRCTPGQALDALSGLGNGFDVAACGETTLLAGGGIGAAPLFGLSKRLLAAGKTPVAVLGFNTAEDVFYENEFKALCVKTDKPGQISLEARMGCGFGACMGCTIDTVNGPKRVCREGPVFGRDEIKW